LGFSLSANFKISNMENVLYNIGQVLGITIIHSLWEGLLVYFILRIVFIAGPALSAGKRYNLAIGAMAILFAGFVYTLIVEVNAFSWVNLKSSNALLIPYLNLSLNSGHSLANHSIYNTIAGYLPYISAIYIAGLIVNLAKLSKEWNRITLIKQSFIPAGQMQQFINKFSKKLDISKHIQLKFSDLIDVPCMMGYFKPIIFLPVSIATYLSACEIEAILLHELSHIKRNDYLVNLLQQIITAILFFNPFVQLVNRLINVERENGCDDLVVKKTGKPLIYAQALLKLEENRKTQLQFALAATGKRYHLLNRIERIMKTNKSPGNIRHLVLAIFLLAGGLGSIAWISPKTITANTKSSPVHKAIASSNGTEKVQPALKIYNPLLVDNKDTDRNILVADTIKHHHKAKITVVDKHGHKKVYYSDTNSASDDSMGGFYSSPEWRAQMDAMKKMGEDMRKKFNSPEWKNQMLAMKKQGEEMKKQFDSPEWKAKMEDMKKMGEDMKKKFDGPEWKAQMENMKKQGEEMKKQFDSPEWKAQMENMKKQGEEMKKKFDSPEWKAQMDAMKKQGEEMGKKFNSPEWKAQMDAMKKMGEDMKRKFDSPEWKAQMENMKKMGEDMQKQFKGEFKYNMKWDLRDSSKAGNDTVGKPRK